MRHVLVCLALLAVAASPRGGCGNGPSYDPCAGKACGDSCTACAPGDSSCVETAVVKACAPTGACLAQGSFACAGSSVCAGKPCGTPCVDDASRGGFCDGAGRCGAAVPCPAPAPCAGKRCGDSCNPCGDASPCPTFAATACDPAGACTTVGTFTCPAADPCAGKACGDRCTIDPPCRLASPPCLAPSLLGYCTDSGGCVASAPACTSYDACAGKACGEACSPCAPGVPCMAILCVTACDAAGKCTCAGSGTGCR